MSTTRCDNCLRPTTNTRPKGFYGALLCHECAAEERIRNAAPDLLAACKLALAEHEAVGAHAWSTSERDGLDYENAGCDVCEALRAAIAKATGPGCDLAASATPHLAAPDGVVAYDVDTPEGAAAAHRADLLAHPYCAASEY